MEDYCSGGYCKTQLPAAVEDWPIWGSNQPESNLMMGQKKLCFCCQLSLMQFDRASISDAKFVASCADSAKSARDSCLLTYSNGQYHAGRVRAFLSYPAPGWEDCGFEEEANIAATE